VPIKPFAHVFPLLWVGFWKRGERNHDAGCRRDNQAHDTLDFYVKMAFVFAGLFVLIRMRRQVFDDPQLDKAPVSGSAKVLAWVRWPAGLAQLRPAACWPT
jgi:hypothetical protein